MHTEAEVMMQTVVVLVVVVVVSALGIIPLEGQQLWFPFSFCKNDTVQSANAAFNIDTVTVLNSYLVSNATAASGFHHAVAGSGKYAVNGLFYCRGDLSPDQCRDCVGKLSNGVRLKCPRALALAAEYWELNCTLRFSNETIFSKLLLEPTIPLINPNWITDRFLSLWKPMMFELKNEIVNGTAGVGYGKRLFGTKVTVVRPNLSMFSLAQCSPDLSVSDCDLCLNASISLLPDCCVGTQGGRIVNPSCIFRTEIYNFYEDPPSPVPELQSLPPSISYRDGGRISTRVRVVTIAVAIGICMILVVFSAWYYGFCWWKMKNIDAGEVNGECAMETETLRFSFETICVATNDFSQENKIGEGGFGDVYQGLLSNGTHIAAKRLSKCSRQGVQEFKNEVLLIAKLQHRNLIRLLGFCLEGPEKILIYEYVSNKTLDHHLFDAEKQKLLDWPKRYMIIQGIARGLLYLHEDSPLKVIHRDLKAANVLLDINMNPKVADFGASRIVGLDESQMRTKRIVGTYGYMPPEYVMQGHYSAKSDVYSFGVLVLEIISGKKNENFSQTNEFSDTLSNKAWTDWMNGNPLQLLDISVGETYSRNEVLKCIHMALLCVQENLNCRPTMQAVMLILNGSSVSMQRPQKPAYFLGGGSVVPK